jgi:hypothetical protein
VQFLYLQQMTKNFAFLSKVLLTFSLIILIGGNDLFSQKWKYYRHEFSTEVGGTNFLGELGGSDQYNPKFYHSDFDFRATRPSFGLGYGYKIHEKMNLRVNLLLARVAGSDEYTDNIYREVRNLSFRSSIYEASVQYEYYWLKEKTGASYKLKGIKSSLLSNISGYFFAGGGGIYFNPQADYNGKWVDLPPLNTEGQGLLDNNGNIIPDYEQFTAIILAGAGFKLFLNKQMSISVEYAGRYTFTDYIDDVSTNYYDNTALRAAYGDASADLADRNILISQPDYDGSSIEGNTLVPNLSWTGKDQQRGSPLSKDYYMYGTVGFHYKFLKGRSIKPRF